MATTLEEVQFERMRNVPAFATGPYAFLSPEGAIDYHRRKHVANMRRHVDIQDCVLLDCGCGNGWNVLAYLLEGGRAAIGLDMNDTALGIAREFCRICGVADRAAFCKASVTALPLADRSVDACTCIEALEHLHGGGPVALQEISRVTRHTVLLSTPNSAFPMIAHDTRLPLAHWLPNRVRRAYASVFSRAEMDDGNVFLSPWTIRRELRGFQLVSRFLGFPSVREFSRFFPHYLPYTGGGTARNLPRLQKWYYVLADALLGRRSFYVLPSLTGIFTRENL